MKKTSRNLRIIIAAAAAVTAIIIVLVGCAGSRIPPRPTSTMPTSNDSITNGNMDETDGTPPQPVSTTSPEINTSEGDGATQKEDIIETATESSSGSRVLVEINKQEYIQGEEIVVTITNNLDTSITTFDQQAFCSIITLERQSEGEWKKVKNCFSGVPSSFVTLEPHTETILKLGDLSSGVYRASIIFSIGDIFDFGTSFVASSSPFTVH